MSAGSKRAPRATMVTPDAPVSAVNTAQTTNPTTASPLGSQPNRLCTRLTRRSEVFDSEST